MVEGRTNGTTEPRRNPDLARRTQALSLTTWALMSRRTRLPDTPRGQVITLRAHQRPLRSASGMFRSRS